MAHWETFAASAPRLAARPGLQAPEVALLEAVRRAPASVPPLKDLLPLFSVLLCEGCYDEAFTLGEAILDLFGRGMTGSELSAFLWPWSRRVMRAVAEPEFGRRQLDALEAAGPGRHAAWHRYCRAVLLLALNRKDEALREHERLRALPAERYFWMRQPFLQAQFERRDFAAGIETCEVLLAHRPDLWWTRCRLAEALLLRGEQAKAFAALDQAEEAARKTGDERAAREVLTWRGEILLWIGEYERAAETLDAALRSGPTPFAHGWRGAARLKLGRVEEALADLDSAVGLDAKDAEALVWRGEAHRLACRRELARRDLEAALALRPDYVWAWCNRGLLRHDLGDVRGLDEDYQRAAPLLAGLVRRAKVHEAGGSRRREDMARFLAAALDQAKGLRRSEGYLEALLAR